jgi:hypothetical protein
LEERIKDNLKALFIKKIRMQIPGKYAILGPYFFIENGIFKP